MIDYLCANADIIIKVMLAKMLEPQFISQLSDVAIIVSVGYSNAIYHQARSGFAGGISFVTHFRIPYHLYTGCELRLMGAIFDIPEVYISIIADTHHVARASICNAKRLKGYKLFLVAAVTAPVRTDIDEFIFANKNILLSWFVRR